MKELKRIIKYFTLIFLTIAISTGYIGKNDIIDNIKERSFNVMQISNGSNKPKVDIKNDNMDIFLIALSNKISATDIAIKLNWSDEKLQKNTELLIKNKLLKKG